MTYEKDWYKDPYEVDKELIRKFSMCDECSKRFKEWGLSKERPPRRYKLKTGTRTGVWGG
jgi:C4-type Zn-finger protein